MSSENYYPKGPVIIDITGGPDLKLITEGPFQGWLCYKHANGQWVTLRKSTDADKVMFGIGKVRQG